jgi:predicted RNase H-like nuclease
LCRRCTVSLALSLKCHSRDGSKGLETKNGYPDEKVAVLRAWNSKGIVLCAILSSHTSAVCKAKKLAPLTSSICSRRISSALGFALQPLLAQPPGLIEVYHHPALVELTNAQKRLPYKASRVRQYWPDLAPAERRARLYREWCEIVEKLDAEIAGVSAALPQLEIDASGVSIMACEDTLDAIICAWVGIRALQGRATPFGDDQSAIWVPKRAF